MVGTCIILRDATKYLTNLFLEHHPYTQQVLQNLLMIHTDILKWVKLKFYYNYLLPNCCRLEKEVIILIKKSTAICVATAGLQIGCGFVSVLQEINILILMVCLVEVFVMTFCCYVMEDIYEEVRISRFIYTIFNKSFVEKKSKCSYIRDHFME